MDRLWRAHEPYRRVWPGKRVWRAAAAPNCHRLPDNPRTDPQDRAWFGTHDRLFTEEETVPIDFKPGPEYGASLASRFSSASPPLFPRICLPSSLFTAL